MFKQIEGKLSDHDISRLGKTVLLTTITATLWGLLQGYFRQTAVNNWIPIALWGFAGFAMGPGLGILVRFPRHILRPWSQVTLAIFRGVTYGLLLAIATQLTVLFMSWHSERPAYAADLSFDRYFPLGVSISFIMIAGQLFDFVYQIRDSSVGWSRIKTLISVGFVIGLIFWGFYANLFQSILSANNGRQLLIDVLSLILCSIPFGLLVGAIGVVSTAHKLAIKSDIRDEKMIPS